VEELLGTPGNDKFKFLRRTWKMVLKILAIILAVVIIFAVGYVVVNSVINLFHGYNVGEAFSASIYDLTHLWGLIKDKTNETIQEFPMANSNITWNTARSW
jgi:hypothetical protein